MKTRLIHTSFWKDNYISDLSPKEKLAFVYLLTNDSVNICGMYQLPDKLIRVELDLTAPELEAIKEKLVHDGKFYFKDGWIKILNYEKYNQYSGGSNETAKERELQSVPQFLRDYRHSVDTLSGGSMDSLESPINKLVISNKLIINKGVVKGIEAVTPDFVQELATEFRVPPTFVLSKLDDLKTYCASHGKKYKDYKATLREWVKKDAMKIVFDSQKGGKSYDAERALREMENNSGEGDVYTHRQRIPSLETGR